jgi:hypothetical protein
VAAGPNLISRTMTASTVLADGRVLVAGGQPVARNVEVQNQSSTELFDPATGRWTSGPPMSIDRINATATLLADGRVLVVGGSGNQAQTTLASTEIFDPVTGRWSAGPPLDTPLWDHTATLLSDGRVLVVGSGLDRVGRAEILDAAARHWQNIPVPSTMARLRTTAVRLPDGRVLLIGGSCESCDPTTPTDEVDLFDPKTDTFAAAARFEMPVEQPAAALLGDGSVLVTSAWDVSGDSTGLAWRYLPAQNRWVSAASVLGGWTQGLVSLPDGRAMLVGSGDMGRSADIYDPATDSWAAAGSLEHAHFDGSVLLLHDGSVLATGGVGDVATGGLNICSPTCDSSSERSLPGSALLPTCMGHLATIVGTPGPDVLTGTPGKDVIAGLGGDDVINGGDGVDTICGGPGDDRIDGGPGKDDIAGDTGNDTMDGGTEIDHLWGGDGNDTVGGGDGSHNYLYGGRGDDHLIGGSKHTDTCIDTTATFTNCWRAQ